jgi:DNA-binding CsgD family transcriptional regulator
MVRLKIKENHKLKSAEVERLIRASKTGASQRELAKQLHASLETVNRYIRRRRQAVKVGRVVVDWIPRKI